MTGSVPTTSNWKAVEDRQPPGVRLKVSGVVTTTRSNQEPQLTKTIPQGANPAILLLDLSIATSSEVGNEVTGTRNVEYREEIKTGQYTSIDIRFEGKTFKVIDEIQVVH